MAENYTFEDLYGKTVEKAVEEEQGFDLGQIERILGAVDRIIAQIMGVRQQTSINQQPIPEPLNAKSLQAPQPERKFTVDTLIDVLTTVEATYGDIPISELKKEVIEHKDELAKIIEAL
jgi:hypothetical protein